MMEKSLNSRGMAARRWLVVGCTGLAVLVAAGALFGMAVRDRQIEELAAARLQLEGRIADADGRLRSIADQLRVGQRLMLGLLQQRDEAPDIAGQSADPLPSVGELANLGAEQGRIAALLAAAFERAGLAASAQRFQTESAAMLQARLADSERARALLLVRQGEAEGRLAALTAEVAAATTDAERQRRTMVDLRRQIALTVADRDRERDLRRQLAARTGALEQQLANRRDTESSAMLSLVERTRLDVKEAERIVAATGLDLEELVGGAERPAGLGGPFVPAAAGLSATLLASVADLQAEIGRRERLQLILGMLPLAEPFDGYRIESGFGSRRDPITGAPALHEGVDLVGDAGSLVRATAPGTIVYAGSMSDYGRLVEIDHGFGIRTRYAHLKSIAVQVGDRVDVRDEIGVLGSSGRATGPHLHYEVRVDDRPYDPVNFLEAGKHVFEG